MDLYQHAPEVWDEQKCNLMSTRFAKDGIGTAYPYPGHIGNNFGEIRYNGGCIRENKYWDGENIPLPIVSDGYEIVRVPSWGYRIKKID